MLGSTAIIFSILPIKKWQHSIQRIALNMLLTFLKGIFAQLALLSNIGNNAYPNGRFYNRVGLTLPNRPRAERRSVLGY